MTKRTEAKWAERVREWRASGLPAEEFVKDKGYEASSLQWAASVLRHAGARAQAAPSSAAPRSGRRASDRSRPPSEAPRFVPVRMRAVKASAEMVVEIGAVRIRVVPGCDVSLLGDVVRALGGSAR